MKSYYTETDSLGAKGYLELVVYSGDSRGVLQLSDLYRYFGRDKFPAVEGVTLSVKAGSIHALLGPNGAGKTTTVRMCSTLLRPSSGQVWVNGIDALKYPQAARRMVGLVLGGDKGFYPRASCRDNLLYFGDLQGVPSRLRKERVAEALERVELSDKALTATQDLSRGLKQRLHLARALLSNPAVLLLDEPTMGLDPDISLRIRDLIRQIADEGVGILLTSHSLVEVEELADEISVIGAGRIVKTGKVADIAQFAGIGLVSTFTVSAGQTGIGAYLADCLSSTVPGVEVAQRPRSGRWVVTIYWPDGVSKETANRQLADSLRADGGIVENTRPRHMDVEKVIDERGLPATLVTREASLEQAYLALAQRLER